MYSIYFNIIGKKFNFYTFWDYIRSCGTESNAFLKSIYIQSIFFFPIIASYQSSNVVISCVIVDLFFINPN
uniref:Uncharacterized protein n=1 Tax=Meloidogyne enterolobii TaxID=390850 RepID=A0A6V7YD63_MELEN|nr:unnamed protein product [Meloidogyne enterolobii]